MIRTRRDIVSYIYWVRREGCPDKELSKRGAVHRFGKQLVQEAEEMAAKFDQPKKPGMAADTLSERLLIVYCKYK